MARSPSDFNSRPPPRRSAPAGKAGAAAGKSRAPKSADNIPTFLDDDDIAPRSAAPRGGSRVFGTNAAKADGKFGAKAPRGRPDGAPSGPKSGARRPAKPSLRDDQAKPVKLSEKDVDAPERIAKALSRGGVASRRDAEKMILDGRVSVNGKVIDTPAMTVTAKDRISVDGQPLAAPEPPRLWLYHKPEGLVTSARDELGRPTVFEDLPEDMPRVMSIGRLDLTSEGLLLLTNDGEIKRKLELPSTGWLRKYRVRVNGRPMDTDFEPLRKGIVIEGEVFAPMIVSLDRQQGANAWLTVAIREGRNREIRRGMEAVGYRVNRLIRTSYGPFQLGDLQPGQVSEVRPRALRDQLGLADLTAAEEAAPTPRGDRSSSRTFSRGSAAAAPRGPRDDTPVRGYGKPYSREDVRAEERAPRGGAKSDHKPFDKPFAKGAKPAGKPSGKGGDARGLAASAGRWIAERTEAFEKPAAKPALSRGGARGDDDYTPKPRTPKAAAGLASRADAAREEQKPARAPYAKRGGADGKPASTRNSDDAAPRSRFGKPAGERGASGKGGAPSRGPRPTGRR